MCRVGERLPLLLGPEQREPARDRGGCHDRGVHSTARRTIHLQPGLRSQSRGDRGSHTCAISTGNNVWCWGSDTNGELGKGGSGSDDSMPDHASFGGDNHGHGAAIGIALGSQHSCAAFEDGSVYCWGDNTYGQLGLGDWDNRSSPTQVDLGDGNSAASIAAGDWHTCALLDDGSATCWGRNDDGQLGDLSTTNRSTPATVAYFTGFASISAGARHTCASQSDMDLYCWGTMTTTSWDTPGTRQ